MSAPKPLGADQLLDEAFGIHRPAAPAGWPRRLLGFLVAVVLFAIMALTFINVFLRYWLSSPIVGSEEIVSFGMAVLIFAALPLVTADERHISVGLLQGRLSAGASWVQRVFILIVSLLAIGIMAWQLAEHGLDLAQDGTVTTVLGWPLAPLSYFMSALAGVTDIVLLLLLWRHLALPHA